MIALRLARVFPLVLTLVLLHGLPRLSKRSRIFGVEVPGEVRCGSDGSGLLRRYQMGLLPFSVAALLASWWTPAAWQWLPIAVLAIAALWLLDRGHAAAVRFALPPPSTREASLRNDDGSLGRRLLWFAPPLAALAATALYLGANWSRFPARYASHFDSLGNPNGWAIKSMRGSFGSLALGAGIVLYFLALYSAMELGSRRGTQRPAMLAALAASCYPVAIAFTLIGLVHAFVPPLWVAVVLVGLIVACVVGLTVLVFRLVSRPAGGPAEVTPEGCWHGGLYFNPEDPALFVDGRTGFGLTANFARRAVWLLMAAIAVVTVGLLCLGANVLRGAEGPAWNRPAYSQPDSFTERPMTVGTGDWKLPGTLTMPRSPARVPGVVLIHGSGPQDRDETILGNKPFRDLAEGLASRGIAVLRYEKRTKEYGAKLAMLRELTVREETVDDAVAAAGQLRAEPGIDPKRVFLLGHSLGGYLMPMMLAQAPEAAGGIMLAGEARPFEDVLLDQFEYFESLPGGDSPQLRNQLEEIRKVAASIKALQPGHEDGPPIFGAWPHYYVYLRDYDPVAQAAKLARPLLILQGERDYQVTMKDFRIWQAALGARPNVTLKSYAALNHLFLEGRGKSVPAEYAVPGHVSAAAIDDIARWILAH